MHKASVICFLVLYMKTSLVNSNLEYRVKVMNDMLSCPGWLNLRIPTGNPTNIIEECTGFTEELQPSDLVARNHEGRIVTKENVEQKIRHAYHFLSCKFAKVLNETCEYYIGICIACQKMENELKLSGCLKELLEMLELKYSIVMRMQGSLSCIYQLSHQKNRFKTGVFESLTKFITFYKNEFVETDLAPTQIDKTIASFEKQMSKTIGGLTEFYDINCRPIRHEEIQSGISNIADIVQRVEKRSKPGPMLDELKGYLKDIIDTFLNKFDGKFGFRYDSRSKTTSLNV